VGDGLVVSGYDHGSDFRGWVARVSASGDVLWERRYERDFLNSIHDMTVTEAGEIVVVGTRRVDGSVDRRILSLSVEGERRWTHLSDLPPDDPELVIAETENGYVVGTTSFDDPLHVYQTDERGRNQTHVSTDPFDKGFNLSDVVRVGDGFVFAGGAGKSGPNRRAWMVSVDSNPTTATATQTPTRTPTPTGTERPTETAVKTTEPPPTTTQRETNEQPRETATTSDRGDGFGATAAGLSLLTAGLLARFGNHGDE